MAPKQSSSKISSAVAGPSGSLKRKRSDPPAGNDSKKTKADHCVEWQTELARCEERKKFLFEFSLLPQEIQIHKDQMLDIVDVALAIISVTEAIASQRKEKFCVYDAVAFSRAADKNDTDSTFFGTYRDERPIIFPWLRHSHIRLCYGQPKSEGSDDWADITIYDSIQAPRAGRLEIQKDIREHLQKSAWFQPKSGDYRFHWKDQTVWQSGGLMCGMHAVFNGWILAFGLSPTDRVAREVLDETIYASAERIIRLAIHGSASSDLIFSWLVCHGFINADITVDDSRKFECTTQIHDAGNLTTLLPYFRRSSETDKQKNPPHSNGLSDSSNQNALNSSSGKAAPKDPKQPPNQDPKQAPQETPHQALGDTPQETPLGLCIKCPVDGHCPKLKPRGPRTSFKTSVERGWASFEPTGPPLSDDLDAQALKQWISDRVKEAEADEKWPPVPPEYLDNPNGRVLGTGTVIAAIASVTEAISLNDSGKDFALYGLKAYKAAKRASCKPDVNGLILGTRKELFIPASTDHLYQRKLEKQEKGGIILAHVLPPHDDKKQITVQWAVSKVSGFDEEEQHRLETELETLIRRLQWWSTSGEDLPGFTHDWNLRCRPQKSSIQSAIHVILNAWAASLNQVLIPDGAPTDSEYDRAFGFIYRAFSGFSSAELIVAFLRDIRWVDSTRNISTQRNFRSTCGIFDDLLEKHVKELFPQMYPELAASSDPNAQRQGTAKDKRPDPVCNNCPVQGHCYGEEVSAAGYVRDLNAEDARTGRWETADKVRAERVRLVEDEEEERESRGRLASGQVPRRPGTSYWATKQTGPFEVDMESEVYGVVQGHWIAHEVHEMSREGLAKLFKNPPADIYLHDMKRLMVDAAELHFELKKKEADEGS